MSLTIEHAGINLNLPLDTTPDGSAANLATLELWLATDYVSHATTGLKAGMCVGVDDAGFLQVANGTSVLAMGLLINDLAGGTYQNVPAYASQKAAVMLKGVATTNKTTASIVAGEVLWSNADGLVDNVSVSGAATEGLEPPLGIAVTNCVNAGDDLTIILY